MDLDFKTFAALPKQKSGVAIRRGRWHDRLTDSVDASWIHPIAPNRVIGKGARPILVSGESPVPQVAGSCHLIDLASKRIEVTL